MEEQDKLLLQKLMESFSAQLSLYTQLRDTVRKLMSKLVLSRGDVSGLLSGLEAKNRLLAQIGKERNSIAGDIELWQERKKQYPSCWEVEEFEQVLVRMEKVIKEFLDEEQKLQDYLEKVCSKENGDKK